MSDFNSTYAAAYAASTNPFAERRNGSLYSGELKYFTDTYVTTTGTDETASDYIVFGRVNAGQVLFPLGGFFHLESGLSTALVGTLGIRYDDASITDDYDALSLSVTLSSEGRVWLDPAVAAYTGYTVLGAGNIVFDPTTVDTPVASKTLALVIPFLVAG